MEKLKNKKVLIISLASVLLVAFFVFIVFFVFDIMSKNKVKNLNLALGKETKTINDCKIISDFDKSGNKENKYFKKELFEDSLEKCEKLYTLNPSLFSDKYHYCKEIISKSDSYFSDNFLYFKNLDSERKSCEKDYLNAQISVLSYGNVYNDFKTIINFKFNYDLSNNGKLSKSDLKSVKSRLLNKISINPKVELKAEDLSLSSYSANLSLSLNPKTQYKIDFMKKEDFSFKTIEKKYFGMRIVNPVSLYTANNLPKFQILEYNSEKIKTQVNLCKISVEDYAKIEVFSDTKNKVSQENFFENKLKKENFKNCISKEISIKSTKNKSSKINFNFDEKLKENGLYVAFFSDVKDLEFNKKINNPLFFGVINSHIMMKVSRDGKGFFFVNDLEGKPLANQEISAYINNFSSFSKNRDRTSRTYDKNYKLNQNLNVFKKSIVLGKTNENGILELDLNKKIKDAFSLTFEKDYEFDYNGLYKSFFVKASSPKYLSFLTSTWNGGIEPWNFGYKTGWSYGDNDEISLSQWDENRKYNSHIYADRVLYLPGEEVYLKGIIRKSADLSIPGPKEKFNLTIKNPKGITILNKNISLNEFGSFSETLKLPKNSKLGYYNVTLKYKEEYLYSFSFNVEVFKNPKFKNEVSLETIGLENSLVKIDKTEKSDDYWNSEIYKGKFNIKGVVSSSYYNGGKVQNANFTYKVYKQIYWSDSYWDDCYYGCYWEPRKTFYTEGKGKLDENGFASFDIPVEFSSNYDDYKYIVEVNVTDKAGDKITGSNSVIAKLPDSFKKYNNMLDIKFEPKIKFVETGYRVPISGGLSVGKWTKNYNDIYMFLIKRKLYENKKVTDVNGFERNISKTKEELENIFFINDKNFSQNADGKLELNYQLDKNGEYVFEYGKINKYKIGEYLGKKDLTKITNVDIQSVFDKFENNPDLVLKYKKVEENCLKWGKKEQKKVDNKENKDDTVGDVLGNLLGEESKVGEQVCILNKEVKYDKVLKLSDLINSKSYFNVISYDKNQASNPIKDDNKLDVLAEKVSYKIGEKAKILVRLPVNNANILITTEKNGITNYEYKKVEGNVFFKEFVVTDDFAPNTYIGVFMVDKNKVPRYKVGYTEIVIDKTDKKSFINIKTDKEKYNPRGEVNLDINVKNKEGKPIISELTVMVVDDSLISLMGNIDSNTLQKIFIKNPFSIQTAMTNIAMLKDYYFSRKGLVGGSGFGNFKGGDSAVSTRNIFKNTAFYDASVITDASGNAKVKFNLPDNLTNFRIMVLSNSKDNHFGYADKMIEVRKNVVLEDKTPTILRDSDKLKISATIFNNTGKDMGFKVNLETKDLQIENKTQNITIKNNKSKQVFWEIGVNSDIEKTIKYTISVLGDSAKNSDKIEKEIQLKASPVLETEYLKIGELKGEKQTLKMELDIPENTDYDKSSIELYFSNSRLFGIEKIAKSLAKYPYGCIEQTTSSTIPNVILKKYLDIFGKIFDKEKLQKNIDYGISRIKSMQMEDGGFTYWPGGGSSDLHITPYVLRSLVYMKNSGVKIENQVIEKAISYLEKNYKNAENLEKAEIYWTLKMVGKDIKIDFDYTKFDRHSLLSFTYGLVKSKHKNKELIEANIELLKQKFIKDEKSYWYWNNLSDKAIFTSLLIDYDYKKYEDLIGKNVDELYAKNWSNYYYSTQTKNNAFIAFIKYLEKNKIANFVKYGYSIGNKSTKDYKELTYGKNSVEKVNYKLSYLVPENSKKINLDLFLKEKRKIYVSMVLKQFPKDKFAIKDYSNSINLKKEVFEVLDENKLSECSSDYYWNKNKDSCENVFKKVENNIYKKGKLYKAKITISGEDLENKNNIILEDYLASSFRVINSKFRTESSSVRQANENWSWSYKEFKPNVVMATANYWWGKNGKVFEYYFTPEFEGTFTNPPVSAYEMYNPINKAYSSYQKIEIK